MSDLLSPLWFALRDEVAAFWCFDTIMQTSGINFMSNHSSVQQQLEKLSAILECHDPGVDRPHTLNWHVCTDSWPLTALWTALNANGPTLIQVGFPWILLHFKREFPTTDLLRLWDVMFAHDLQSNFHLFVGAAILGLHRGQILAAKLETDTLLQYMKRQRHNVTAVIAMAETMLQSDHRQPQTAE